MVGDLRSEFRMPMCMQATDYYRRSESKSLWTGFYCIGYNDYDNDNRVIAVIIIQFACQSCWNLYLESNLHPTRTTNKKNNRNTCIRAGRSTLYKLVFRIPLCHLGLCTVDTTFTTKDTAVNEYLNFHYGARSSCLSPRIESLETCQNYVYSVVKGWVLRTEAHGRMVVASFALRKLGTRCWWINFCISWDDIISVISGSLNINLFVLINVLAWLCPIEVLFSASTNGKQTPQNPMNRPFWLGWVYHIPLEKSDDNSQVAWKKLWGKHRSSRLLNALRTCKLKKVSWFFRFFPGCLTSWRMFFCWLSAPFFWWATTGNIGQCTLTSWNLATEVLVRCTTYHGLMQVDAFWVNILLCFWWTLRNIHVLLTVLLVVFHVQRCFCW